MNAKQKASQIYDQYWSDVSRRLASNKDPLPDIRPLIEKALIDAVEEDRRSRPHQFVGRNDRDCELCGNPDRDQIHYVPREWVTNATKAEREAFMEIVKKEIELWDRESVVELRESIIIEIRARSQS